MVAPITMFFDLWDREPAVIAVAPEGGDGLHGIGKAHFPYSFATRLQGLYSRRQSLRFSEPKFSEQNLLFSVC